MGATLDSAGKWCPPSPIEKITDAAGNPVPLTEAPCEQAVDPALANTLLTGLSKDDTMGTAAGGGPAGRLDPADGRQDRHHPGAQVGGVHRDRPADVRCGDHLRQLERAEAAVRRGRLPVPVSGGQHLRRQDPGRDLVRRRWCRCWPDQPVLPLPGADPRFVEGGAESKVPNVVGDDRERRPRPAEESRVDSVHAGGGQCRRPGHCGGAEPIRHRAARGDHRAEHQQRRRTIPARRAR